MVWRRVCVLIGVCLAVVSMSRRASAQDNFPGKPIRVVIPYAPGSVADVFARIVAQNMAAQWNGASIVVEAKSGANGSIAAEEVARSAPDGYTWLLVTTFFTASPSLTNNLRWDPCAISPPSGRSAGRRISSSCRRACRSRTSPSSWRWRRRNLAR